MQTNQELFIELSSALTGISKDILAPNVTNYDLPTLYYQESEKKFGTVFNQMIENFGQLISGGDSVDDATKEIANNTSYSDMTKQITFLWYMGAWAVPNDFGYDTENINAITYQKGFVWNVMQSHPMGYNKGRYGYWGVEPAPLDKYIGESNE